MWSFLQAPAPLISSSGPAIAPSASGTPTLTTNLPPAGLSASGQTVTVYFSGVVNPSIGIAHVKAHSIASMLPDTSQKYQALCTCPAVILLHCHLPVRTWGRHVGCILPNHHS